MIIIPAIILTIDSEDDRAYMTTLYQKHYALMLKTAWVFTKERADVEDIVSDSCAALIMKLDTVRALEQGKLRSYIVTTVRNTAIDFCRNSSGKMPALCRLKMEIYSSTLPQSPWKEASC